MSERIIPEHIDPFRFAEQNLRLDGTVKLEEMHRLHSNANVRCDNLLVNLVFGVDEQKTTFLKGHLEAKLTLQCQRCMEPYIYEIMSDFTLGVVNTLEEANDLPEVYEPALAKNGELALRELIEDELILNLPIIPRHEPKDCKIQEPMVGSAWQAGEKVNPFHVLKSMKDKDK